MPRAADEARINAMATARAVKAVRIYLDISLMIGHRATVADIESMNDAGRDAAVRSAGVKAASEGTWKVVRAIAAAFGGADAQETAQALPMAPRAIDEDDPNHTAALEGGYP